MWILVIIAKKKKINLNCFRESEANKAKYAKQMAEQKKDAESSVSYILHLFMPLNKKELSFVFRLSSIILTPKVHPRCSKLFPVPKKKKKYIYLYVKLKRQLKQLKHHQTSCLSLLSCLVLYHYQADLIILYYLCLFIFFLSYPSK